MSCEYEKIRLRNIEDNKRILKELGLLNPFNPLPRVIKKAPKRKRARSPDVQPAKKVAVETGETGSVLEDSPATKSRRRRSARIRGIETTKAVEEESEAEEEGDDEAPKRKFPKDRPNVYGAIPGVEMGTVWQMRSDCSYDGIHRPWVAGIHGGPDGALSIALSGGYEDDIDMGDCFTYTGEGGRDLKGTKTNPKNLRTAPQSKDQSLTKGNLALVKSCETGNPIRVIRGYKCRGPFAPEDGYRYDGLYKVEKYWFTTGTSGFGIYKFAFRRLEKQAPPPWTFEGVDGNNNEGKDAGPDDEDKKEAAEMENMSVEEKLRSLLERDGLTYNPSETKTESESETEDMEADANETNLKESDNESKEVVEEGDDEKYKNECKEDETNRVKSDIEEQSNSRVEEIETDTEVKQDVEENEPNESKANKSETETELKQEVEEIVRSESKGKESETEAELKQGVEEIELSDSKAIENEIATEVKQDVKDEHSETKCNETETKTAAEVKDKSETDVDVEGDSDSESENDNVKSEDVVKRSAENKNKIKNSENKTESDTDEICSQDSGIASQENVLNESEAANKMESNPKPLKEVHPQNAVTGDNRICKAEKRIEPKTPTTDKKPPKSKTPKSESKTPKKKEGSAKKRKSTTPKSTGTSKGKQLTMMDMFKPKPKS